MCVLFQSNNWTLMLLQSLYCFILACVCLDDSNLFIKSIQVYVILYYNHLDIARVSLFNNGTYICCFLF